MIKNILVHIGGIGGFGVISIALFFAVFLGAVLHALSMKSTRAHQASLLPMQDGDPSTPQPETSHE
ncbi:MAG: hypothetical protein FJ404_12740 [Verrucomicrobia bacterium]|nr:hypothetical protein [Verrucomicrobiota bacterium]